MARIAEPYGGWPHCAVKSLNWTRNVHYPTKCLLPSTSSVSKWTVASGSARFSATKYTGSSVYSSKCSGIDAEEQAWMNPSCRNVLIFGINFRRILKIAVKIHSKHAPFSSSAMTQAHKLYLLLASLQRGWQNAGKRLKVRNWANHIYIYKNIPT